MTGTEFTSKSEVDVQKIRTYLFNGSCMRRESHVQFLEQLGGKFLWLTHHSGGCPSGTDCSGSNPPACCFG